MDDQDNFGKLNITAFTSSEALYEELTLLDLELEDDNINYVIKPGPTPTSTGKQPVDFDPVVKPVPETKPAPISSGKKPIDGASSDDLWFYKSEVFEQQPIYKPGPPGLEEKPVNIGDGTGYWIYKGELFDQQPIYKPGPPGLEEKPQYLGPETSEGKPVDFDPVVKPEFTTPILENLEVSKGDPNSNEAYLHSSPELINFVNPEFSSPIEGEDNVLDYDNILESRDDMGLLFKTIDEGQKVYNQPKENNSLFSDSDPVDIVKDVVMDVL